jgi:hypothetical protein
MLSLGYLVQLVVIVFLSCVAVGLIHEVQRLRRKVEGFGPVRAALGVGSRVPAFRGVDMWSGTHITDRNLGELTLVIFLSSFCSTCREAVVSLRSLTLQDRIRGVLLVCSGTPSDCEFVCQSLQSKSRLICDESAMIAGQFGVSRFPAAVLVRDSLTVSPIVHPISAHDFHTLFGTWEASVAIVAT